VVFATTGFAEAKSINVVLPVTKDGTTAQSSIPSNHATADVGLTNHYWSLIS
jgi:hypothetical protein